MKNLKSTSKGFTLVELLVVMAILGVLMLIAVPRLSNITENSRKSVFDTNHASIVSGIQMYVGRTGHTGIKKISDLDEFIEDNNGNVISTWASANTFPKGSAYTINATGKLVSTFTFEDATTAKHILSYQP